VTRIRYGSDMRAFGRYSDFYDALYHDKNYEEEVSYILELTKRHGMSMGTALDVGCGTGGHMIALARRGIDVTGFDLSEEMVRQAVAKIEADPKIAGSHPIHEKKISVADIRSYGDGNKYDCVLSMFAVMGYLTSSSDLVAAFSNIRNHLKPQGLFIFDVWFASAVFSQKPEERRKEISLSNRRIVRLAHPEMDIARQVVRVNYKVLEFEGEVLCSEVDEIHEMRFFSIPELDLLLGQAGFIILHVYPFMDLDRDPTVNDWNICVVARPR
jgi:SAM-dependent methyltransferase